MLTMTMYIYIYIYIYIYRQTQQSRRHTTERWVNGIKIEQIWSVQSVSKKNQCAFQTPRTFCVENSIINTIFIWSMETS